MATYQIDYYGRSYYGTATGVQYSAAPFTANEFQYGRLILTWASPLGDWILFRLVKNLSGFAVDQNDGELLIDINSNIQGAPSTQYDDLNCVPGRFYYYSIFVGVGSSDPNAAVWWRAGDAMNIAVQDLGWTDTLWNLIPRYYRKKDDTTSVTDDTSDENVLLKRFLDIFGYQMNDLATSANIIQDVNNANTVSYQAITSLGAQFGVNIEPALGPRISRNRVFNATYINQEKGTEAGLRALISAATGWSSDISYSPNMLLNSDQSSFVNPVYNQWNGAINYAIGERVVYNANIFQANVGNYNVPPPLTATNNAQWTNIAASSISLENPMTRGQSTWGVHYDTSNVWANPSFTTIRTAVGTQSTTDPTVYSSNSLTIQNDSGSTQDISASLVAPIWAAPYDATVSYTIGNYVTYGGLTYRSLTLSNFNNNPSVSPINWKVSNRVTNTSIDPGQVITDAVKIVPVDQGSQFTASFSAMNRPFVGSGTHSLVRAAIDWYDEYGKLLGTSIAGTNPSGLDKFLTGTLGSDIASQSATDGTDSWASQPAISRSGLGYVYRNTSVNGMYISLFSLARADVTVATTVKRFATVGGSGPTSNGIIFRYSNSNNYFRLGQNKLEQSASVQRVAPTGLAATVKGSPTTTSTRYYKITATDGSGETLPSAELTVTGTPTTYTSSQYVTLTWNAVSGATGYKIYRSLSTGAELLVQTVGAVTTVDDKATGGTTSPPGTNTSAVVSTSLTTVIDLTTVPLGAYTDGDRMAIRGSASNITLYKNGTQIWTGTNTFNQTATRHGLWVGY